MIQSDALDLLKLGENVFLTGAAGSGKTHLLNTYINYLRSHGVGVAVTASTGIAATHLNGRTIHSWSGIGIRDSLTDSDIEKLLRNKRIKRGYLNAKVLVIDEISMLHPGQLDMVDTIGRHMLDDARPFGGLQVILCGDFFQLPPVMRNGAETSRRFAFYSSAWSAGGFRVCYLHEQYRQRHDPLLDVLNDIRSGTAGEQTKVPLRARYKREPEGHTRPTRLYARNINVDSINDRELERLAGEEKSFVMETGGLGALVEVLVKSCLAPENLRLKVGAEVMFIKNAVDGTYVNGTRGTVEAFDKEEGWPVVRTFDGDLITATAEEWKLEDEGVVRATIVQVPLRLAWAVTIHKSQGMTLDAAEIDLSDAFEPGMGYVALSRVRSLTGLKLLGLNDIGLQVNADVLVMDTSFQQQSVQAQEYLGSFPEKERRQCQQDVLVRRFEGSLGEAGTAKPGRRTGKKKPPTHEITLSMVEERMPLREIARQRKLTVGTILGHLERLKGMNALPDVDYLRREFSDNEFGRIVRAFHESEDGRLTPVYRKFGGRYSFEDLRLARLLAW